MDEWGLIYWKVGKNKVVSKFELNRISLNMMINKIM